MLAAEGGHVKSVEDLILAGAAVDLRKCSVSSYLIFHSRTVPSYVCFVLISLVSSTRNTAQGTLMLVVNDVIIRILLP